MECVHETTRQPGAGCPQAGAITESEWTMLLNETVQRSIRFLNGLHARRVAPDARTDLKLV